MNIIKLQSDVDIRKGVYYEYDADSTPLGEGGMGRVFKGFRVVERTGERTPIAIKAIYDNIPERVIERARREASIQLDNDNLIKMYGFVETTSHAENGAKIMHHYHVIMELLVGVTLEDAVRGIVSNQEGIQIPFAAELYGQYTHDRGRFVLRVMKAILSGLMALHDKGYIHRDIDPSNIMITIDGKIKLIDFGICKQIVSLESLDKGLTASGVFMGKVNYAAPELVLGDVKSQNATTDIYALGILMYQLYTGHLPFSGTDQDILAANLHKPLPMKDVRMVEFRKVINKATNKTQAKRYASAAEFRVDLEHISLNDATGGGKRSRIVIGVAATTTTLLLLSGLFFLLKGGEEPEPISIESVAPQPTCAELYDRALITLNSQDSIHLHRQAKDTLRVLVEDSLFYPAKIDYYVLLINSDDPVEVRKGFTGLKDIIQTDSTSSVAFYECGLTLSQSSMAFRVPHYRQEDLGMEYDLRQANEWLYKAIQLDSLDYKSVYWALDNLVDLKLSEEATKDDFDKMKELYYLFFEIIEKSNDVSANEYVNAMKPIAKALYNWGIIDNLKNIEINE